MNITFLIGNGFDRNLGLATAYSDFIKEYKKVEGTTETLQKFNKHIKENEEMWSVAEIALGKFTEEFEMGDAEKFSECHADLCESLATYLKKQEERIDYKFSKEKIEKAFSKINEIIKSFPVEEYANIYELYKKKQNEYIKFNFITFNYTQTVDKCIEILRQTPGILGSHTFKNEKLTHILGDIIHIHGTVDKEMIFGVNDDTQISKNEIFDCEDGDLYKGLLIKQTANASYLENTDSKGARVIDESHIIYVYGMSIGQTDKLWWDRICKWLNASGERHLIVYKYEAPAKGVFPIKYQLFERRSRKEITSYCDLDINAKTNIEKRIHIATDNIFDEIKNIAEDSVAKELHKKVEKMISVS